MKKDFSATLWEYQIQYIIVFLTIKRKKLRQSLMDQINKNQLGIKIQFGNFNNYCGEYRTRTDHLNTASVALQPDELIPL